MKPSKNQLVANTHVGHWKSQLWVIILFAALALVGLGIVLESSSAEGKDGTVATYVHGRVNVTIPYRAGNAGAGRLTLEILDPEDQVVAQSTRDTQVNEGSGRWHTELQLAKVMPIRRVTRARPSRAPSPFLKSCAPPWFTFWASKLTWREARRRSG